MRTLDDLDVEGKRVFVRVDFNVPLDEDRRITEGPERRQVEAVAEGVAAQAISPPLRRSGAGR